MLLALLLPIAAALAPAAAVMPIPFHFWVLAMSYQTEFCAIHQQNPECPGGIAQVKGLTLHGLWPNVDSGAAFEGPIRFKRPAISAATVAALATVMPSARCHIDAPYDADHFCLPDHEWEKHGTLSTLDPERYFQTAKSLADRFRALPAIIGLIATRAGATATASELAAALALDLPGEASKLVCDTKSGEHWLSEIEVALDFARYDAFPTPASFHTPFPDYVPPHPSDVSPYCPPEGPIRIR